MNGDGYYVINAYYKIGEKLKNTIRINDEFFQKRREILRENEMMEMIRSMNLESYGRFMVNGIKNQLKSEELKKTKIMGIVNLTPDSFYSNSRFTYKDSDLAIKSGADILDIGGESTRPGSTELDPETEISRLNVFLQDLRSKFKGMVSLDSRHYDVVRTLLPYIDIINDVSGLADDRIANLAIEHDLKYVLMHIKGEVNKMTEYEHYEDLPGEVSKFFIDGLKKLHGMGMKPENIIIDPGLGFSKNAQHDYFLVKNVNVFSFGFPRLVGHSRKRFLGAITGSKIEDRLPETLALSLFLNLKNIEILRVHDVSENIRFLEEYRFLSQT
jgi:dihydropteroate synthase